MRIATVNGLRNPEGNGFVDMESFTFGEFQKVELILRKDIDSFDTYGFKGYIDWCDENRTEKIVERTTHEFSYPEGYKQQFETINEEEVLLNKVILYFSERIDYGYIDGQLLSQVDKLNTPFPNFVFFEDYNTDYVNGILPPGVDIETQRKRDFLLIMNPNFTAPNGLTKNKKCLPVFSSYVPVMEYYGMQLPGGPIASAFKVMPKIYDELKSNLVFPLLEPDINGEFHSYNPLNTEREINFPIWEHLEKIEPQGSFDNIETLFPFSLEGYTPQIAPSAKLLAYPKGGRPKVIKGFYNLSSNLLVDISAIEFTDDFYYTEYIKTKDIPKDLDKFYSVERLEALLDSWKISFDFTENEKEIEDPLPLGPDYSKSTVLKYIETPDVNYLIDSERFCAGPKLFYWPIPQGVEYAVNTNNVFIPYDEYLSPGMGRDVMTYKDYQTLANVSKSTKRILNDNEGIIANALPTSVKEVYNYYSTYYPTNKDGTRYNFPPLHEGVEVVSNYFSPNTTSSFPSTFPTDGFVVPGLPSTVKFISGYCRSLFAGYNNSYLTTIDDLILEPNLCNNVEIVSGWMSGTYAASGIDISQDTGNKIRPQPSLSPTGKSYGAYNDAFSIVSYATARLGSDNPNATGVTYYTMTQNRHISIDYLLPYLSDLSSVAHTNPYRNAFNGEYSGVAEDLGAISNLETYEVIKVDDNYYYDYFDAEGSGGISPGYLIGWYRDNYDANIGDDDEVDEDTVLMILNLNQKSGELYYEGEVVSMLNDSLS